MWGSNSRGDERDFFCSKFEFISQDVIYLFKAMGFLPKVQALWKPIQECPLGSEQHHPKTSRSMTERRFSWVFRYLKNC